MILHLAGMRGVKSKHQAPGRGARGQIKASSTWQGCEGSNQSNKDNNTPVTDLSIFLFLVKKRIYFVLVCNKSIFSLIVIIKYN